MSETTKISIGKEVSTLDVSPEFDAYSGVEIIVSEDTTYFAGNESGRILTIQNPWGTQAQAQAILATLQEKGFQYQPYVASEAILNPAAEIGDGITISDTYSGIYKISRNYSPLMAADLEAPQDEEIDHEYPYEPKQDREITRRFSALESEFRIQSDEIAAKVSETGGSNSSVGWSLKSDAWTVKANGTEVFRIDSSGASVTGVIRATSGQIGGFNISSSALYNGMDSLYSSSSGVYVGTDGISVGGGKFRVTSGGSVSAQDMTLTGTLNIGGTDIKAAELRSGAQSAYTNGAAWTSGSNWGAAFGDASDATSGSYQSFFRAGLINATVGFFIKGGTAYGIGTQGFYCGDDGPYKEKSKYVITGVSGSSRVYDIYGNEQTVVRSLGGTTIYYLGK